MKSLILFVLFTFSSAQEMMSKYDIEQLYFKASIIDKFSYQQADEEASKTGFLLSVLVPGLDQYLNDRYIAASIFAGIEIGLITMAISYNNKGIEYNQALEDYANSSEFGFSRVRYYKNIYEAINGIGTADPSLFDESANEAEQFKKIKNSDIWNDLKSYEKDPRAGDGVHSLPNTKTQQYYELIGKYGSFYHGWKGLDALPGDYPSDREAPALIKSYYKKRNKMNDAYKTSTIAISGIVINHLLSGLEALIDQKRRLHLSTSQNIIKNEYRLEMSYDF